MNINLEVITYFWPRSSWWTRIPDAENLHAQTSWGDRKDQSKDLLTINSMSDICPCSATDHQSGSNEVWKSSKATELFWKKSVYLTNLKQMFKYTATNLDIQPTLRQQRLTCALKIARLLPGGYFCLNDTGNEILFRINWWRVNQCFNVAP